MKLRVPFTLCMVVGIVLAASGCVAITNKSTVNGTTESAFAPFSNASGYGLNKTINATGNSPTKLKGPLSISISGFPVDLPVTIDNKTAGIVTGDKPINVELDEGIHTVMVCMGTTCEQDNVTVTFGKKSYLDFGDQLRRDVEYPLPTARILEFFQNGNGISINMEFINPTTKPLTISVEVSCGYSYIDSRSNIKLGDSAKSTFVQRVDGGQHLTQRLDLNFASGSSYNYDVPAITNISIK